jgi:hypothetical protein
MIRDHRSCPDCSSSSDAMPAHDSVNRRDFLRTAGAVGAAASLGSLPLWTPGRAWAADQAASTSASSPE